MRRSRSPLLASLCTTFLAARALAGPPARTPGATSNAAPASATSNAAPASATSNAAPAGATSNAAPAGGQGSLDANPTPESALARATAFYEAGQYAQCTEAFFALFDDRHLSESLSDRAREQARVYYAACLIAIGKFDAADDQFRVAIRNNPQMAVPNAIVFPPAVIERFIIVRSGLLEEIRRAEELRAAREREAAVEARRRVEAERRRVARLEELAGQETLVKQSERWLAFVPFGVGQFQNRQYFLGGVFLASELVLAGTAITATSIELSLNSQANGGRGIDDPSKVAQLNQNLRTANQVSLYSAGAFLLVAAGGILQANFAFVPEFPAGTRKRPIPKAAARAEPRLVPSFGAGGNGFSLGVTGRF
jgi:tetratricopeptide (TPR) repeat protein